MNVAYSLGFNYLMHLYCALLVFALQLAFHLPLLLVGSIYSVTLQPILIHFFNGGDARYRYILETGSSQPVSSPAQISPGDISASLSAASMSKQAAKPVTATVTV